METVFARYFCDVRLADFPHVHVFRETYKFCDEFLASLRSMWSGIRGDRMERELSADQLAEHWTLEAAHWQWLANKTGATRLGFAALLKFFESEGRFPRNREELPPSAIHFLAQQVHVPADAWGEYRWEGRTFELSPCSNPHGIRFSRRDR
jgi:hypothetical protein